MSCKDCKYVFFDFHPKVCTYPANYRLVEIDEEWIPNTCPLTEEYWR